MEIWPPLIAQKFYVSLSFSLFLFSRLSTYSSTEESWITKRFSLMAFAETGTFNINDGRNAYKNYLLSSDSQSDGLCGVRNRANQPWMKTSTCRTAHMWKNMICSSWLDVSLFSHVGKAIRDIWLVYIGLRTKIYSAAFQCINLSMYMIMLNSEMTLKLLKGWKLKLKSFQNLLFFHLNGLN